MKLIAYILTCLILSFGVVYYDGDAGETRTAIKHEHSENSPRHNKCASHCNISNCFHFLKFEIELSIFTLFEVINSYPIFNVRFVPTLSLLKIWQPPKSNI